MVGLAAVVLAGLVAIPGGRAEEAEEDDAPHPLHSAAEAGDVGRVLSLLDSGVSVDARDTRGVTALMAAVSKRRLEVARALLERGADADASSPSGWTALMQAASAGDAEAVRVLLDAGADPDARDRHAGTALDVAQAAGEASTVALLRRRGSRGSGKSVGDLVCSLRWSGNGLCGVVERAEATRYRVRITGLPGCEDGCAADADCSAGRPVGGAQADSVRIGASIWIRSWCLTHTGLAERGVSHP
jgi:hypothetical protein